MLSPMSRDLDATSNPDVVMRDYVIEKAAKVHGPRRLSDQTQMHRDGHHLCVGAGSGVEGVNRVLKRGREVARLSPAETAREARVVGVQRVRNDKVWNVIIMR